MSSEISDTAVLGQALTLEHHHDQGPVTVGPRWLDDMFRPRLLSEPYDTPEDADYRRVELQIPDLDGRGRLSLWLTATEAGRLAGMLTEARAPIA